MSDKLCPYCGGEPKRTEDNTNAYCDGAECGIWHRSMLVQEWNRRFVCRDRNGKPVYAGDEVMLGKWQGKIELNLVDGAMIVTESHRFRLSTWNHHEIELIQETE